MWIEKLGQILYIYTFNDSVGVNSQLVIVTLPYDITVGKNDNLAVQIVQKRGMKMNCIKKRESKLLYDNLFKVRFI